MPTTTAYSFGDVVLVPFPFTDQTASKKRPAVVVSADAYHQRRPDVIVMAVTTQILRPAGPLGEVLIGDWQGAGLPKASLIKPVIATIEQRLILKRLGALKGADVQALCSVLRRILGWGCIPTRPPADLIWWRPQETGRCCITLEARRLHSKAFADCDGP